MNILPAIQQQRVLILSAVVVVAILVFGSWVAAKQLSESATPTMQTSTSQDSTAETVPQASITVQLERLSEPTAARQEYRLALLPSEKQVIGLGIKLDITSGTVVSVDQEAAFIADPAIAPLGWQLAVSTSSSITDNRSISSLEIGFINLEPNTQAITSELVLGTFAVTQSDTTGTTQLVIDETVSSAFTKDGEELQLVLEQI